MESGQVTGQVYGPKRVQFTHEKCLPEVGVRVKDVQRNWWYTASLNAYNNVMVDKYAYVDAVFLTQNDSYRSILRYGTPADHSLC